MTIDEYSIAKFGVVPKCVIELAKKAHEHGINFSQTRSCLYIFYKESTKIKSREGWIFVDSFKRSLYNSIFYCARSSEFYMESSKDFLLYDYITKDGVLKHASQFFMPEVTCALVNLQPSKRNYI
jgi:hypothetical protein